MEQKNTSEISVTCLCSYLSIFDLLDWAELFSPVRFDFSASGGPVEVMLESAPPPAGRVQQYTCSQYSRSQKSTSGGHGPGWVVGGTGGEMALKWAVWTSYLPFHLFCPGFIYLYLCFHWGEVSWGYLCCSRLSSAEEPSCRYWETETTRNQRWRWN